MVRILAVACTLLAFLFLINAGTEGAALQQKAQMVKGTIKSVDFKKNVLVINQKLKNDIVDRELSIEPTTEFVVTKGGTKKEGTGADGLALLEGLEKANVAVKCDKDVKVLKVTVTVK